jgi:hypothetical protein
LVSDFQCGDGTMVKRFKVAVINKSNLKAEAHKRFKDRNYSKKTLNTYEPDISKAKFKSRDKGFSIYEVPLKKKSTPKSKSTSRNYQTGTSSKAHDRRYVAKKPGKRKSKSGNTYIERRRNRSDKSKKRRL